MNVDNGETERHGHTGKYNPRHVIFFPTNLLCTLCTTGMKRNIPNERIINSKQRKTEMNRKCTRIFSLESLPGKFTGNLVKHWDWGPVGNK